MLAGDVRNGMKLIQGVPGSMEVLATLPDDDTLTVQPSVFSPILSVARHPGNCDLLDDLAENVIIGRNRETNLLYALTALAEPGRSSFEVESCKERACELYSQSFRQRVLDAQREAVPNVIFYLAVALGCYLSPMVMTAALRLGIEKYAKVIGTDIAVVYAAQTRQKEFCDTFGALAKLLEGVESEAKGSEAKGSDEDAEKLQSLMPEHDDTGGTTLHVIKLLARHDKKSLARYPEADLRALRKYVQIHEEKNESYDRSLDAPARRIVKLMRAQDSVIEPVLAGIQWCGRALVPVAIMYYVLAICKGVVDVLTDKYKLSRAKQVWNAMLLVAAAAAVANACKGEDASSVSITAAVAACMLGFVVWKP